MTQLTLSAHRSAAWLALGRLGTARLVSRLVSSSSSSHGPRGPVEPPPWVLDGARSGLGYQVTRPDIHSTIHVVGESVGRRCGQKGVGEATLRSRQQNEGRRFHRTARRDPPAPPLHCLSLNDRQGPATPPPLTITLEENYRVIADLAAQLSRFRLHIILSEADDRFFKSHQGNQE